MMSLRKQSYFLYSGVTSRLGCGLWEILLNIVLTVLARRIDSRVDTWKGDTPGSYYKISVSGS